MEKIARAKPEELNDIEEEIAWLCEESLLLPTKTIPLASTSTKQHSMSAGLLTEAPNVNWTYVLEFASHSLKLELQKIRGGVNNRSLSRIVRNSKIHVRLAFAKRREMIANLITCGSYRRIATKDALPSKQDLIQSGFMDILQAKLKRRMQQAKISEVASTQDLRVACNQRLGDAPPSCAKKRPVDGEVALDNKSAPKSKRSKGTVKSSYSEEAILLKLKQMSSANDAGSPLASYCAEQKSLCKSHSLSSILTQNEEELIWVSVSFHSTIFFTVCTQNIYLQLSPLPYSFV
jgi:hypothetical protein